MLREYFARYVDQFVLIGGTAATLAMEKAASSFRATKDFDIALDIEALSPGFGEVFWGFVRAGGQRDPAGQRHGEARALSLPEAGRQSRSAYGLDRGHPPRPA